MPIKCFIRLPKPSPLPLQRHDSKRFKLEQLRNVQSTKSIIAFASKNVMEVMVSSSSCSCELGRSATELFFDDGNADHICTEDTFLADLKKCYVNH